MFMKPQDIFFIESYKTGLSQAENKCGMRLIVYNCIFKKYFRSMFIVSLSKGQSTNISR